MIQFFSLKLAQVMHSQYFCVVGLTMCFLKSLQNHIFTAIPSSHGVTCISFRALTPKSTWSYLFWCSTFHKKEKAIPLWNILNSFSNSRVLHGIGKRQLYPIRCFLCLVLLFSLKHMLSLAIRAKNPS